MDIRMLIGEALKAKKLAYAPYSNFRVGAALMTEGGKLFTGCNIETASYSTTLCAERVAIFKAVSEGQLSIRAIAIVGDSKYTYPCGSCRQVIREFGREANVIVANSEDDYREYSLKELLPHGFGLEDLEESIQE